MHHATVSVLEAQQGHQTRRQAGFSKMRLKSEKISTVWCAARWMCRQRPGIPRTVRRDNDRRVNHLSFARRLVLDANREPVSRPFYRHAVALLTDLGPAAFGRVK
jgi:hypothetical protein